MWMGLLHAVHPRITALMTVHVRWSAHLDDDVECLHYFLAYHSQWLHTSDVVTGTGIHLDFVANLDKQGNLNYLSGFQSCRLART
jgi:hypothetical protein